jgi:hypothetical protein
MGKATKLRAEVGQQANFPEVPITESRVQERHKD